MIDVRKIVVLMLLSLSFGVRGMEGGRQMDAVEQGLAWATCLLQHVRELKREGRDVTQLKREFDACIKKTQEQLDLKKKANARRRPL